MSTVQAVVAYEPQDGKPQWRYEDIATPRQPKEHEVLVRMVAVGICHTDLLVSSLPGGTLGVSYPKIMGHEGAGYVEAVGPGVTVAQKGDPVLLSYAYCGSCELCTEHNEPYCEQFGLLNVYGDPELFQTPGGEKNVAGKFFGQSSFAGLSVVGENSVVNVKDSIQTFEELKRCAPMGCGLMTGCGAVMKNVSAHEIVIVAGLGAVGMGAILAAKQMGCKAVVAVDRVDSRLSIAQEFGATHVYNTTDKDPEKFVTDVQGLVDGRRIAKAIDTTAYVPLIQNLIDCLGKRGKILQIGAPALDAVVSLNMADFFNNTKIYETHFLGDSKATELVPQMVEWYKQGKFPIDRIIRFYHVDKVSEALEDMKKDVIKPILVF